IACVDLAQREPIGVRVLLDLEHFGDEHVAQILMDRHDAIDGRDLPRESVGDVLALERPAEERFEPTAGNDHRGNPFANCSKSRTSETKNSRMPGIPCRSIAIRSGPIPNATPGTLSLSPFDCSNTGECDASNGSRR